MADITRGYDKRFLGPARLPLPVIGQDRCAPLLRGKGSEIRYTHYSAFVDRERRLPLLTAVNIRGEEFNAPARTGAEPWEYSDQIAEEYQIDNTFYRNDGNTFDRGHLVRRVDPCWGSDAIVRKAEAETFRWVNCTPQHKKLNQRGGAWFQLEQHVMEHGVKGKIADVAVFSGAVLDPADKVFIKKYKGSEVQIPILFWKVIVWKKSTGQLAAVGFMMSQWEWIKNKLKEPARAPRVTFVPRASRLEDDYFVCLKFEDHKTYQVPLSAIEQATGITFPWKNVSLPYSAKQPKEIREVSRRTADVAAARDGQRRFISARAAGGRGGARRGRMALRNVTLS